jgi:hypothetical protein
MKTYYVKSRTGEIRPKTTKAFIVSSLRSDLISVKSLSRQGYSVVHGPDPKESGIHPIINEKKDKSKSFVFMSEHSIFYINAQAMSAQQFGKVSGYEKWHRRQGHTINREIHGTIPYVKGLEELTNKAYQQHTKCASCTQGKSTLEDFPEIRTRADKPLKQVNIDSFSCVRMVRSSSLGHASIASAIPVSCCSTEEGWPKDSYAAYRQTPVLGHKRSSHEAISLERAVRGSHNPNVLIFFRHRNSFFRHNRFSTLFFSMKIAESGKIVLVSCIIDFKDIQV